MDTGLQYANSAFNDYLYSKSMSNLSSSFLADESTASDTPKSVRRDGAGRARWFTVRGVSNLPERGRAECACWFCVKLDGAGGARRFMWLCRAGDRGGDVRVGLLASILCTTPWTTWSRKLGLSFRAEDLSR
jgi:hypothetical protein